MSNITNLQRMQKTKLIPSYCPLSSCYVLLLNYFLVHVYPFQLLLFVIAFNAVFVSYRKISPYRCNLLSRSDVREPYRTSERHATYFFLTRP